MSDVKISCDFCGHKKPFTSAGMKQCAVAVIKKDNSTSKTEKLVFICKECRDKRALELESEKRKWRMTATYQELYDYEEIWI